MKQVPSTPLHALQFLLDHTQGRGQIGDIKDAELHAESVLQDLEQKLHERFNELLYRALMNSNIHKLSAVDTARLIDKIRDENAAVDLINPSHMCASYGFCDAGNVFASAFKDVYGFAFIAEDELCEHIRHASWVIDRPEPAIEKLTNVGQIRTLLNVFDDNSYDDIVRHMAALANEGADIFVEYRNKHHAMFAECSVPGRKLVTLSYTVPLRSTIITWTLVMRQILSDIAGAKQSA